jgi:hypothetical protein
MIEKNDLANLAMNESVPNDDNSPSDVIWVTESNNESKERKSPAASECEKDRHKLVEDQRNGGRKEDEKYINEFINQGNKIGHSMIKNRIRREYCNKPEVKMMLGKICLCRARS